MNPDERRRLKAAVDREMRRRVKGKTTGRRCAGCGGKYDDVTLGCVWCEAREKQRWRKLLKAKELEQR